MSKRLFLILLFFITVSFAGETEQEKPSNATNAEHASSNTDPEPESKTMTPDSFNPSEQLSQDIPAAFPVDI
ncbi:MAG: hypothetical protein O7D86_04715 [Proteobacteria bacterium]|nr:hypothetical protein [Pseudomonadota bacterium]